jgi:hypothetical protein
MDYTASDEGKERTGEGFQHTAVESVPAPYHLPRNTVSLSVSMRGCCLGKAHSGASGQHTTVMIVQAMPGAAGRATMHMQAPMSTCPSAYVRTRPDAARGHGRAQCGCLLAPHAAQQQHSSDCHFIHRRQACCSCGGQRVPYVCACTQPCMYTCPAQGPNYQPSTLPHAARYQLSSCRSHNLMLGYATHRTIVNQAPVHTCCRCTVRWTIHQQTRTSQDESPCPVVGCICWQQLVRAVIPHVPHGLLLTSNCKCFAGRSQQC